METKLEIVILQHPKEKKKKTYGTVPILQLCLKNVRVLQGNFTMPEGGDETTSSIAREKHVYHALALNFESQLQLGVELDTKNTVVLFPDLEQDDIFLLKHPELKDRRAINLGLRGPESEEGLLADKLLIPASLPTSAGEARVKRGGGEMSRGRRRSARRYRRRRCEKRRYSRRRCSRRGGTVRS
eukprot:752542-Hanusia_phi.AAC.10